MKKSSINENLKVLRRYLNIAIKKGLLEKSPFEFYKLKRVKSNPEFLTENELQVLIDLYDSNELAPTKQKTLRYFLFGTQTGMRVSDIRIARHEQIINGILRYLPVKTEDSSYKINIPLTNLAKRLIKDENPHRIKGLLFDSTKYSNLYQRLVEVVVYAGIEKNIGFHTSRHTFATLFLKKSKRANGLIVLQKLLGHARIETTMVYTHILKDDIIEAMAEFET